MLICTIGIPFLGALALSLTSPFQVLQAGAGESAESVYQIKLLRTFGLVFTCATYVCSILLWINFDIGENEMQFTQLLTNWNVGQLSFGLDQLSLFFILLTTTTIPIVILSSFYMNSHMAKLYLILLLLFEGFLLMVFSSLDLVLFYISFEAVLIPLSLLIGIFGGIRRIQAAFLLFLYTLVGSLPILLSIIKIYSVVGMTHFGVLSMISPDYSHLVWLGIFLGLAVKTPLVPFHLWLKTAHSEANTATSMILAGLVLKISSYGFLRILLGIFPNESAYFSPLVMVIALISVIYTSFSCLRQTDFKQLIAYSSVAHMGIVIIGLFSNTVIGIEGGIILSLAHGFTSPALFFLLGGVVYDRYHSRTIRYYRGLSIYIPLFAMFFFIFSLANIATPITSNWVGEFMSLAGSFQNYPLITAFASLSIFLSACYSIIFFSKICYGQYSVYLVPIIDVNRQEFHVLAPLLFFTLVLGLYPNFVLDTLHLAASSLVYNVPEMPNLGVASLFLIQLKNKKDMTEKQFKQWFTGFVDAEGYFIVQINSYKYIMLQFGIHLHIDDVGTLRFIQERFKGVVRIKIRAFGQWIVSDFALIKNIILPHFQEFPLLTAKSQSFSVWEKLFQIRLRAGSSAVPKDQIALVVKYKSEINTVFNKIDSIPEVKSSWLVGFIEGDGSFYLTPAHRPILAITQHTKSLQTMEAISRYFQNIKVEGIHLTTRMNHYKLKNNVLICVTGGLEAYSKVLVPWVLSQTWATRKAEDIKWWCMVMKIFEASLHTTLLGRCAEVQLHINNERYTTSLEHRQTKEPELMEQVKLLFSPTTSMKIKATKGFSIWVYDNENQSTHFFPSITYASEFGQVSKNTLSYYRDTGRLIRGRYFVSSVNDS